MRLLDVAPGFVVAAVCAPACTSAAEKCAETKTREDCEKACDEGDPKSCHRYARIVDELEHLDPEIAKAAFERACETGSPMGCIGRRGYCPVADIDALTDEERACRASWTEKACDLGDELACRTLEKAAERERREAEKAAEKKSD